MNNIEKKVCQKEGHNFIFPYATQNSGDSHGVCSKCGKTKKFFWGK